MECLDLSPKMVAKCQRRGLSATACDFTVAGTIGSVAAEGSLDAVYAMNSLLHVPKRQLSALTIDVSIVSAHDVLALTSIVSTVAVAAREPRPPERSRSERAELSARSAWTWDACTWDGVMRWRSFLSWSLVPAWMDIGDRVVVTCHAAGDRCGQPATVVRRVLSVPLSFLDTYQIAFADGSTMFITRNNLSLQAREFHNLLGCISENSV